MSVSLSIVQVVDTQQSEAEGAGRGSIGTRPKGLIAMRAPKKVFSDTELITAAIEGNAPVVDANTAAAILACSPRTICRMCEQGKLKSAKVMGMWRVNKAALFELAGMPVTADATDHE